MELPSGNALNLTSLHNQSWLLHLSKFCQFEDMAVAHSVDAVKAVTPECQHKIYSENFKGNAPFSESLQSCTLILPGKLCLHLFGLGAIQTSM